MPTCSCICSELLWKAADQCDSLEEARNIPNFGWGIEGSAIIPAISTVAPDASTPGCMLVVAALQSAKHTVAQAAAATAQAFHARTTANERERRHLL